MSRDRRLRIGLLLAVLVIAGGLVAIKLHSKEDLPVNGPVPPSSIPAPDAALDGLQLRLTPVASLDSPTALAVRPGDDSLYVTEQVGRVRRIRRAGTDSGSSGGGSNGFQLDDQPVLDISRDVIANGEQGLLGIAFSGDGATMYVAFTNQHADQQLDELTVKGDQVDTSTRRTLLVIPDFAPNHNGGGLVTGPDGYLYWAMGDGGGAGDPHHSGQDPHDLLGDILRIDPTKPGTDARPYAIPPDNPFADGKNGAPEVWQYGLRNPWRFSFDRSTHDLWIGDVGQSAIEEVDFLPAPVAGGQNFGWSDVEGTHPYRKPGPPAGAVPPIYEYDHGNSRCSISGGFVYRGSNIPQLQGTYLFADYCDGKINGLVRNANGSGGDGAVALNDLHLAAGGITAFGEDASGEMYVLSQQSGVARIDSATPPPTTAPSTTAPPTTATVAPAFPPTLSPDPGTAADQLVAAERAIRDPASTPQTLDAAAHIQQLAYRKLGRDPTLDDMILGKAGPDVHDAIATNLDARHELAAIPGGKLQDNLPAWRIVAPAPADDLVGYYHEGESQFGVGWNYLAAINLIESALGRIQGFSSAGAQGPMQFMPATWDAYGDGDIDSPHDSIIAAARYLAHNGFADGNIDGALYSYNNSDHYVNAIKDIAAVLAADPTAFAGYYRWEVFYVTTAGDVHLPVGYESPEPIPAADYVAAHPQE
jgi:glucose/arabinose dehydrogenase